MTPAIIAAKRAGIPFVVHEYQHEGIGGYGEQAAAALGVEPERVFKTLVASLDRGDFAVAIVPVAKRLDLKALAGALRAKRASMAQEKDAERATGYVVGGISPLGQKRLLPAVIDNSILNYETVYVSAGERGLQIELAPEHLARLMAARVAAISR
ncbi:MAG: Cys-tRNA(Pro) deacylase [Acidiferrobacterales bacterium]